MENHKYTKGYSLIEVLVALTILLLALTGPMVIAMKGLQSSYYSREKITATYLAQEGVEAIIAIRNDSIISAVKSNNLANSWDWVGDTNVLRCFTVNGCNLDFRDNTPINDIIACGAGGSGCELYFNASSTRAKYSLQSSGGTLSGFTRVINLVDDGTGKGVEITSTIYWKSRLFQGTTQSLTLNSAVFSLYE